MESGNSRIALRPLHLNTSVESAEGGNWSANNSKKPMGGKSNCSLAKMGSLGRDYFAVIRKLDPIDRVDTMPLAGTCVRGGQGCSPLTRYRSRRTKFDILSNQVRVLVRLDIIEEEDDGTREREPPIDAAPSSSPLFSLISTSTAQRG